MSDASEISRNLEIISAGSGFILPEPMKRESLQDWVNRKLSETGYSHAKVSERAKERGHKISTGYVNNLAQGDADNPSPKLMRALAVGFGVPLKEVVEVVLWELASKESGPPEIETLRQVYSALSPEIRRQKKAMIEMLIREIQREL